MKADMNMAGAVLAFLREHAGRKFLTRQMAEALGLERGLVSNTLSAIFTDARRSRGGLQRERSIAGTSSLRYWFDESKEEVPGASAEAQKIARWMHRHRLAARPSEIAKAIGLDVEAVARELEAFAAAGAAVRCELLTRSGSDRFEYRMAQSYIDDLGWRAAPRREAEAA